MKKIFLAFLFCFFSSAAMAQNCITTPLPFVFQNGTVADATQVNSDFNQITSGVNSNCQAIKATNGVLAHAYFTPRITTGTVAVLAGSYNISAITFNATTGLYTASFQNNPINSSYSVIFGLPCGDVSGNGLNMYLNGRTASNFTFGSIRAGSFTTVLCDPTIMSVAGFQVLGGF